MNAVRCSYVIRIIGRNPLSLTDLVPPALFLLVALTCREAGAMYIARSFPLLASECVAYTVLAFALSMMVLASAEERGTVRRWLLNRGLLR